jgi:hypothetical protein
VLVEGFTHAAVEADADRHVLSIHDAHELVKFLWRVPQPNPGVDVNIDDREPGPGEMVLVDTHPGRGPEPVKQQWSPFAAIERRVLSGGKTPQGGG